MKIQVIVRPEAINTRDLILEGRPRLDDISLEELETKNPLIGLLPRHDSCKKPLCRMHYKMLLKHPTALLNCMESNAGQKGKRMTLKRKRNNSESLGSRRGQKGEQ